jgi:hypothetical protein
VLITPSAGLYSADGLLDFCLALAMFRHNARDGAAVPGNDEGCAALDVIEELGKVSFGFRSLDSSHKSTSCFD